MELGDPSRLVAGEQLIPGENILIYDEAQLCVAGSWIIIFPPLPPPHDYITETFRECRTEPHAGKKKNLIEILF